MTASNILKRDCPEISVVITCHQRKQFLKKCIDSVLNQTMKRERFEILLSIDFLDDEIESYCKEKDVAVVYDPTTTIGFKMAKGLELARGNIICFLNDDDEFTADKLEKIAKLFNNDTELTYVHNNWEKINKNNVVLREKHPLRLKQNLMVDSAKIDGKLLRKAWKGRYFFNDSSISIRRSDYVQFLPIIRNIAGNQDNILFYLAAITGKHLLFLVCKLTLFRAHPNMSSSSSDITRYAGLVKNRMISWFALADIIRSSSVPVPVANAILTESSSVFLQYVILRKYTDHIELKDFDVFLQKFVPLFVVRNLIKGSRIRILLLYLVKLINPKIALKSLKTLNSIR